MFMNEHIIHYDLHKEIRVRLVMGWQLAPYRKFLPWPHHKNDLHIKMGGRNDLRWKGQTNQCTKITLKQITIISRGVFAIYTKQGEATNYDRMMTNCWKSKKTKLSFTQNCAPIVGPHASTFDDTLVPKMNDTLMLTFNKSNTFGLVIIKPMWCVVFLLVALLMGNGATFARNHPCRNWIHDHGSWLVNILSMWKWWVWWRCKHLQDNVGLAHEPYTM